MLLSPAIKGAPYRHTGPETNKKEKILKGYYI
jgi:hypothetical protein